MKIPIILSLGRQGALLESASLATSGRDVGLEVSKVRRPPQIELDPSFAAVPLGRGSAAGASLESLQPGASESFAVRGFVDENEIANLQEPLEDGSRVFSDPKIAPFMTCPQTPAIGDGPLVQQKLGVQTLHQYHLKGDKVAVAICDTGIDLPYLQQRLGTVRFDSMNSWTNPHVSPPVAPGLHLADHGTMCAYDVLLIAPEATLLDYPILGGSVAAGSAMGSHLSIALKGFASLLAFWGVEFAKGGSGRYNALVINNSWGMYHPTWDFPRGHPGRYSDNPNHPFNVVASALARSGADILFAAGNCGDTCPAEKCQGVTTETIRGSNSSPEVLTLAGCDTSDLWVGYSSQGPGIAGMHREKPDLTAYTHFLGSEVYGPGVPDTGTSTACPVAAGCIAALRSSPKIPPAFLPPSHLFAQLRSTARQAGGNPPGWNRDYGYGIINPVATATTLGVIP
jgi:hypothetical protein